MYNREKGLYNSSLALLRFRSDQGEVNQFYWTGSAANELLGFTLKSHPGNLDPMTALSAPTKFERHLGHEISELQQRVKGEARWRRLLTVVLLASAFERYMVAVATAASSSDPTLEAGFPKKVDGALLLKYNLRLERPKLEGLVKGTWSTRLAAYRKLFGYVPKDLAALESSLERLRQLRNGIAHDFGLAPSGLYSQLDVVLGARRDVALDKRKLRASDKAVIAWLQDVGAAATAIDRQLTQEFIGGFELIELFLAWKRNPDGFERTAGIQMAGHKKSTELTRFTTAIGTLTSSPVSLKYVASLRSFIDTL
jgi:hypothetical protein